jgi:hypothetical protein
MKFKFLNFQYHFTQEELLEDFMEVECPLPYSNLPDGEYLIRGDKAEHRKKYWKSGDCWVIVDESTRDNGHFMCEAATYKLYPQLSEKEWAALSAVPFKCLSRYWQRALYGYGFDMELRDMGRKMAKDFLKLDKE